MKTKIENIMQLQATINEYENAGYKTCKKDKAVKTICFVDKITKQQKTVHFKK